jgi:acetyltransferase-like isoleucine patch superfamily enzyme
MEIGNYAFIGPKVTTANDRRIRYFRPEITDPDQGPIIEDGAVIGAGAALLPRVRIGKGAFVAMGAVVTKNVPPFTLVMGVPAKVIRHVNRDEVVQALQSDYSAEILET